MSSSSSSSSSSRMKFVADSPLNLKALYWIEYLKDLKPADQLKWFKETCISHMGEKKTDIDSCISTISKYV
jgi:hypothetical protein